MASVGLRVAGPRDAEKVALLHADSWRRNYRGAYADAFLDGDVLTDRRSVWTSRLTAPGNSTTVVAEDEGVLVGFVHVVFDQDRRWGSLVDNLHVSHQRRGTGAGTALLVRAAGEVAERAAGLSLYLWVLEQNTSAQRFYRALGGTCVEPAEAAPGGPDRLNGSPKRYRFAWPDASGLGRLRS